MISIAFMGAGSVLFLLLECRWHRNRMNLWLAAACFMLWTLFLNFAVFAAANYGLAQFTIGEGSGWFLAITYLALAAALIALLPVFILICILRKRLNWIAFTSGSFAYVALDLAFLWMASGIPQLNWW